MSKWNELEKMSNEWEKMGIPYVTCESLIGVPYFVEEYELFNSALYGPGVRILLSDGQKKVYTSTFASIVVKGFSENETLVNQLIKDKEPIKFVLRKSMSGRSYLGLE